MPRRRSIEERGFSYLIAITYHHLAKTLRSSYAGSRGVMREGGFEDSSTLSNSRRAPLRALAQLPSFDPQSEGASSVMSRMVQLPSLPTTETAQGERQTFPWGLSPQ